MIFFFSICVNFIHPSPPQRGTHVCLFWQLPRGYKDQRTKLQWHCSEVEPGDCIIFNIKTVHGATANKTQVFRLSCDTRVTVGKFVPVDDPPEFLPLPKVRAARKVASAAASGGRRRVGSKRPKAGDPADDDREQGQDDDGLEAADKENNQQLAQPVGVDLVDVEQEQPDAKRRRRPVDLV